MCADHRQPETNLRPFLVLSYAGQLLGNSLHAKCPLSIMRLHMYYTCVCICVMCVRVVYVCVDVYDLEFDKIDKL